MSTTTLEQTRAKLKVVAFEIARANGRRHLFSGLQLSGVNKSTSDKLDHEGAKFVVRLDKLEALDWDATLFNLDLLIEEMKQEMRRLARSDVSRMNRALKSHVYTQQLGILRLLKERLYG